MENLIDSCEGEKSNGFSSNGMVPLRGTGALCTNPTIPLYS